MTRAAAILLLLATAAVPEYLALGFSHILPYGADHILFILGLFFLTKEPGPLLVQMTLFTLAHSLTLGISLYGVVDLPSRVVEVAIALSIAFIAIENLFASKLHRWRPAVVFVFGLIHGLGFAHTFAERSIPPQDFLPALLSFNLGIELGQIAVVALAFAAVSLWWKRDVYQKRIARPASALIALCGLFWAVERSL
jgi:hypothetical protein